MILNSILCLVILTLVASDNNGEVPDSLSSLLLLEDGNVLREAIDLLQLEKIERLETQNDKAENKIQDLEKEMQKLKQDHAAEMQRIAKDTENKIQDFEKETQKLQKDHAAEEQRIIQENTNQKRTMQGDIQNITE